MHRPSIPADRLPKKAVADFVEIIGPILEIADYIWSQIFRVFFFVVDLLTLFASV